MPELSGNVTEDSFQGKPIRNFEGTFQPEGGSPASVALAIHPNLSRRIIINVPGVFGDIHGYADKYKALATHVQTKGLGAVIRTGGWDPHAGQPTADIPLRAALQYARDHAWEICGEPEPEVMLMGFSAGASAIAGTAQEFPEVTRVLLLAPSGDMGEAEVRKGLAEFKGEVCVVIGDEDEIVGPQAGQVFFDMATGASHKELVVVPHCGHKFRGEANGRIMSEAPFYAFSPDNDSKPAFPDPHGGVKLYD